MDKDMFIYCCIEKDDPFPLGNGIKGIFIETRCTVSLLLQLFIFLQFFYFFSTTAQVVDDSTKNIFGVKTTQFITEDDLRYGICTKHSSDTSLVGLHDYNFIQKSEMYSQHLGNLGTAYYPLNFTIDSTSSPDFGFNSFNAYYTNPAKRKYYDSKSPFADLFYMLGSKDEQIFSATFSRNITRNWNLGLEYKRMASDKKIGSTALHDNQLDYKGLDVFSWLHSPGYRYHLLLLFSYTDHKVKETGGVFQDTTISKDDFFDGDIEGVNLYEAQTHHFRREWQVYQFYDFGRRASDTISDWEINAETTLDLLVNNKLVKDSASFTTAEKKDSVRKIYLQFFTDSLVFVKNHKERMRAKKFRLFHRINVSQRTYRFMDNAPNPDFYINFIDSLPSFTLFDNMRWNFLEQTAGLSLPGNNGNINGNMFHSDIYVKTLQYNPEYESGAVPVERNSLIAGINFAYERRVPVPLKFILTGWNYLSGYDQEKNYLKTYLEFYGFRLLFSQSMNFGNDLQKFYQGDIFNWDNTFKPMTARWVEAGYQWQTKNRKFVVNPTAGKINIDNLIYYNDQSIPLQSSEKNSYYYLNLRLNFYPGHFGFENHFQQNILSDTGLIRIPGLHIFNRIYYENTVFSKKMPIHAGFDLRTTDSWFAYSYNPVIQQFYLQNMFAMRGYTSVDFFLNFRVGDALVFIKITHLNQGFVNKGYFASPWYPAYPRTTQVGVNWRFFD